MSRYLRFALLVCLVALLRPAAAGTQAQTVTLTITHAGPSSGRVGVVPTGRLCDGPAGASCDVTLTTGDTVTISANGLFGAGGPPGVFSGGTGSAAACATTTCTFTITANSSVTVTFDLANGPIVVVTATLAGDGQGEVGANNSRFQNFDPAQFNAAAGTTYVAGSVVSLRATAAADARFSGYSAGTNGAAACGTDATCSFTANANTTFTATFHALTALTVSPATASIGVDARSDVHAAGHLQQRCHRNDRPRPDGHVADADADDHGAFRAGGRGGSRKDLRNRRSHRLLGSWRAVRACPGLRSSGQHVGECGVDDGRA